MFATLSQLSQKQRFLVIIGVVILIVLLAIVGSMYGRFLKTQVVNPATYSASGELKTDTLGAGTYTLQFTGRDATSSAEASTTFAIVISDPTPNPYDPTPPLPY